MDKLVVRYLETISEEMYVSILSVSSASSMESMWKDSGFPPKVDDSDYTSLIGVYNGYDTECERFEEFKKAANKSQSEIIKKVKTFMDDPRDRLDKSLDMMPACKRQYLKKYRVLKNNLKAYYEKNGHPRLKGLTSDE